MNKILTLIISVVILYTILEKRIIDDKPKINDSNQVQNVTNNDIATTDNQTIEEITANSNFLERTLSKVLVNILKTEEGRLFFENMVQPMNKPIGNEGFKINNNDLIKSIFRIKDSEPIAGKGPATCGHVVTIAYQAYNAENGNILEKEVTFTLGNETTIPVLNPTVVGMMVGQTRNIIVPLKYLNNSTPNSDINHSISKLQIKLINIMPNNFANDVKIFDDEIAYKKPLLCGEYVKFNAYITDLATGEVIYNSQLSKKIAMKIGDVNYPMIFSHALHGKIPTGTRTVIAKGGNFKSLGMGHSIVFPNAQLAEEKYFMLELKDFE